MKINILLAFLIFLFPNINFGQLLVLHDTVYVNSNPGTDEIIASNMIYNTFGADSEFQWQINVLEITDGWEIGICESFTCYSPAVTTNVLELMDGDSSILNAHFFLNGIQTGYAAVEIIVEKNGFGGNPVSAIYILDLTTSSISNTLTTDFVVYPNPVMDQLSLINHTAVKYYSIFGMDGQVLIGPSELTGPLIEMKAMIPGEYLLFFYDEKGAMLGREKIVKL